MKIKILHIITAVFVAAGISTNTYILADDLGQGDTPVDSVVDDLQPLPAQSKTPTGSPDEYETETTPNGDVKKPPALGADGKPVKYNDESGDYYWGMDGLLYPWPPPKKKAKAALKLNGLDIEEKMLLYQYSVWDNILREMYTRAIKATEAKDLELQEKISKDIEFIRKQKAGIKKRLEEKKKEATKAKKTDDAAFRDAAGRADSIYNKPNKRFPGIYRLDPNDFTTPMPFTIENPAPKLSTNETTSQTATDSTCSE